MCSINQSFCLLRKLIFIINTKLFCCFYERSFSMAYKDIITHTCKFKLWCILCFCSKITAILPNILSIVEKFWCKNWHLQYFLQIPWANNLKTPEGVFSPKLYVNVPVAPWKFSFHYTNFSHNYTHQSVHHFRKKSTKFCSNWVLFTIVCSKYTK